MSQTTRATREDLQNLHSSLVWAFTEMLKKPEELNASMIDVIRLFLKDNGFVKDVPKGKDMKEALADLTDTEIPFLPSDLPKSIQ